MSPLSLAITLLVVACIGWAVVRSWAAFRELRELEALLSSLLAAPDDPRRRTHFDRDHRARLEARGFEASDLYSRQAFAAKYRSAVLAERGKLSTYIEVMTTLGLLGTVVGLILAVLQGTALRMDGIWTALLTTLAGLLAAVASKLLLEVPGDKSGVHAMELLGNESVVASLPTAAAPAAEPAEPA